ncbi:hypothetical protein VNI00_011555 [Paramarasmius palmivorus]|uniref:Uncharacterized protein n=1 Tax=Paramarasmius palmivorus TaxID=297713 RepID=A0AAW0CC20_9AGAR
MTWKRQFQIVDLWSDRVDTAEEALPEEKLSRVAQSARQLTTAAANARQRTGQNTSPYANSEHRFWLEMEKQKAQALAEGKKFYDPVTVQTWYRENNNTIEYAVRSLSQTSSKCALTIVKYRLSMSFELWKGRASSKQPTHFVLISVEVDENQPEDPKLVRYKDAGPVPYDKLEQVGAVSALLKKAISEGYMVLFFVDVKHNIRLLEFHEPPPSEPYLKEKRNRMTCGKSIRSSNSIAVCHPLD